MRHRAQLSAVTLACVLGLVGCGQQTSQDASSSDAAASDTGAADPSTDEPGTSIPDDFPLSVGMAAPEDEIPTARTGTGLRDLALCGTAPLRGLGLRDRMVADNSGGEALDTRELVLLGSPEEATQLAQSFTDLPTRCDTSSVKRGFETLTEVRGSSFGPSPAVTLLQTYQLRGEPVPGTMVIHVVPAGAALLVTVTYGEWADDDLDAGIAGTADALRRTVAALAAFDDQTTTPSCGPQAAQDCRTLKTARVGSARLRVQTYGEGSLESLDAHADGVTATTQIVAAMCVFTRTGC